MPRNPNRYPKTPEGLAKKARNETKNAQPIGLGVRPHGKIMTKKKYIKDKNTHDTTLEKKSKKSLRGPNNTESSLKSLAQMMIEYSQDEGNLDIAPFLKAIGISNSHLFHMIADYPEMREAYEMVRTNLACNHYKFLYKTPNPISLQRSAYLHGLYSDAIRREERDNKAFEAKIKIESAEELVEARKRMIESGGAQMVIHIPAIERL